MHEDAQLIHFDLKPDNILVSSDERPYVTDLGFARDMTKYGPQEKVEVGFTYKYSHWRLHDVNQGARVTTVPEKSKNVLLGRELHPRFDLFAFGRTLQEVLKQIEDVYGKGIHSDYTFIYLHLVASLCLDGLNSATAHTESFVSDQALDMPLALFRAHKFSSFRDVRTAFERLLGYRDLRVEIPELDEWAAGTINVSDLGITTLTPRVRALIDHPLVYRLTEERQLGLLDSVFPTATHSRFQHSLGVYHAVGRYISALYYDPENPTFRVLFSAQDCIAALVATVVHDVGHTTFGHDLEEVDKDEFSHSQIGKLILRESVERDAKGRTLTELVSGEESDCWGIPIDRIQAFLARKSDLPVHRVYHDILDGQLDADKLDYLLRDSVEARVQYGRGIDHQRFLRSLTTAVEKENKTAAVRLAVKQKGAASAEAFAFARYQLYQALYWHHTFRAIKAMLLTATAHLLGELRKLPGPDLFQHPVRQAYVDYVIRGKTPAVRSKPRKRNEDLGRPPKESIDTAIARRLATNSAPGVSGVAARDRTLVFLWKLADDKDARLLEDLMARRYYKRVLEIPVADLSDPNELLLTYKTGDFHRRLEGALLGALRRAIQDQTAVRESLREDEALTRVNEVADQRYVFLADLPLRGWVAGGEPPAFVSDFKRRHFRSSVGLRRFEGDTLWSRQLREMMMRVAFFRIFCEPTVHTVLTRVMDVADIVAAVEAEFTELTTRVKAG